MVKRDAKTEIEFFQMLWKNSDMMFFECKRRGTEFFFVENF